MRIRLLPLSLILLVLALAGCVEDESDANDGDTNNRPPGGDGPWKVFQGAPDPNDADSSGFKGVAALDGEVYVAFANHYAADGDDPSGLWRYDGDAWELVWRDDSRYLLDDVVAGSDGRLYVVRNEEILQVDPDTGSVLDTITEGSALAGNLSGTGIQNFAASGGRILAVTEGDVTDGYTVSVFDPSRNSWSHVPVGRDLGKTGVRDVLVDDADALWVGTRDVGVFRAASEGDWNSFEQVAPADGDGGHRGGDIFLNAQGTVHFTYEITKYTQISGLFRWDGDGWAQVHEAKGYAVHGEAVPDASATAMLGGRFPEWVFKGSLKWPLPEAPGTGEGDSFADADADDGTLWALKDDGAARHIVRLDVAAATSATPYDADLDVATARNLDNVDAAEAGGIAILADGRIIAGVNDGEGGGRLAVLASDGENTRTAFEVGAVRDLAARPDGETVLAATAHGVKRLKAGKEEIASLSDTAADRVAVDAAGNVAIVQDKTVTVVDTEGNPFFSKPFDFDYVEDVAIDAETGMVYVVGFSNDQLPGGNPVQGPHLRAYDLDTNGLAWSRFEFSGDDKGDNIADARLYRVEIGADGRLYVLGESAGTETVFRYDGTRLGGTEVLTQIDHYNDLWNSGSAHIAYHARLDKATGEVRKAQLTMARLPSSGESNSFRVSDIAADATGRTFIVGETAASSANRDGVSINGVDVPDYDGSDPSFLALRPDFSGRLAWHPLDAGGAEGMVTSVATRDGKTVLLSEYEEGELFTTMGPDNSGGSAVHVTVIEHDISN